MPLYASPVDNLSSGPAARIMTSVTTSSLAPGAKADIYIPLGKSFNLLQVKTTAPAWLRLYTTPTYRSADAARLITQDPTGEHGLISEDVTNLDNLTLDYPQGIFGMSLELPPVAKIALTVTNKGESSTPITVTYTHLIGEG